MAHRGTVTWGIILGGFVVGCGGGGKAPAGDGGSDGSVSDARTTDGPIGHREGGPEAGADGAIDCSNVGCAFQACGEECTAPCGCCPPVCDGSMDAGRSGCRTQADCGGEICFAPDEVNRGAQCVEMRTCESHADCAEGFRCTESDQCRRDSHDLSAQCQPECAGEDCPELSCDETTCRPTPCDQGYVCPDHTTCDVDSEGADAHGCVRNPCSEDGDCGDGVCVKSGCHDELGRCEPPAP